MAGLFGGGTFGFEEALRAKYAAIGQQSRAQETAANAEANLNNTRAGLLPSESAANVGLTNAQAGLASANTRNVDETTKFVAPLAKASIFNTRAQGALYGQQALGESQLNGLSDNPFGNKRGLPVVDDKFETQLRSILKEGLCY